MVYSLDMVRVFKGLRGGLQKKGQVRLPIPHPEYKDRNFALGGRSFYFFDFDDNIVFLTTPIYLFHKKSGEEYAVQSGEYARIRPLLGLEGDFKDFEIVDDDRVGSFRNFRDQDLSFLKRALGKKQSFISELDELLSRPDLEWKGPSWDCFYHAVYNSRPVSLITARGHAPETVKAGIQRLVHMGHLRQNPNYLTIYPVTHPQVQKQLLPQEELANVPQLKRAAIRASVEEALRQYGEDKPHRFGMSDDDVHNLELITAEMTRLKSEYPHLSFFVIESGPDYCVKREVTAEGLSGRPEKGSSLSQLPLF